MVERRSMGQAINLTPEKMAFIKGQETAQPGTESTENKAASPKTVEVALPSTEPKPSDDQKTQNHKRPARQKSRELRLEPNEILDQLLVPVTFRLQHKTSQALKRAYLEQKLKYAKPDTIQEIGEEAIAEWLLRNGFLN